MLTDLPVEAASAPSREALAARVEFLAREIIRLAAEVRRDTPSAPPRAPSPSEARFRLAVEGVCLGRRTRVLVNGEHVALQDSLFILLLRFVFSHLREPNAWSAKADLGVARRLWLVSRLRCALQQHVHGGVPVLEADGRERFRLSPLVVVESVDVAALAKHPDAVVRKLAADWRS